MIDCTQAYNFLYTGVQSVCLRIKIRPVRLQGAGEAVCRGLYMQ